MQKIIIIGCGYAGLTAAWKFSAYRRDVQVTVIDRGAHINFSPLLPDCIGRGIPADSLRYPIMLLARRYAFRYIHDTVTDIDCANKSVRGEKGVYAYDYLVVASGCETNFYGQDQIRSQAYALDCAADAARLQQVVREGAAENFVVSGAGYTGIEIATNLSVYFAKHKQKKRIVVVERAPQILGPLPQWMREYVSRNLDVLGIEVRTSSTIERVNGSTLTVSGERCFEDSVLIWAAGVKTGGFLQRLGVEKNPQGRVKIDDYLRFSQDCFAIGDAGYFAYNNSYLRMAVQFAIAQGHTAVYNCMALIRNRQLKKFIPKDFGYIIPMANNVSCGNVFGKDVRGLPGIALHYSMGLYRAYGFGNKMKIVGALLGGRK